MAGLDNHCLRSGELHSTAVGKLDVDLTVRQEPNVGMHAEIGAHNGLDVFRPVEPSRVDHTLDAGRAGMGDVELYSRDLLVLSTLHWCEERYGGTHRNVLQSRTRAAPYPSPVNPPAVLRLLALAHPLRIQQAVKPIRTNPAPTAFLRLKRRGERLL